MPVRTQHGVAATGHFNIWHLGTPLRGEASAGGDQGMQTARSPASWFADDREQARLLLQMPIVHTNLCRPYFLHEITADSAELGPAARNAEQMLDGMRHDRRDPHHMPDAAT